MQNIQRRQNIQSSDVRSSNTAQFNIPQSLPAPQSNFSQQSKQFSFGNQPNSDYLMPGASYISFGKIQSNGPIHKNSQMQNIRVTNYLQPMMNKTTQSQLKNSYNIRGFAEPQQRLKPITLVIPNNDNNNIVGNYNNLSINSKVNTNSNIYRNSNIHINPIPNSNTNISTLTTINENRPNSIIINQAKQQIHKNVYHQQQQQQLQQNNQNMIATKSSSYNVTDIKNQQIKNQELKGKQSTCFCF